MTRRVVGQHGPHQPQLGVLAKTRNIAGVLAQELGIRRPMLLSPRSMAGRGQHLRALVVDESCWPLDDESRELLVCLDRYRGDLYRVARIDPRRLS